MAAAPFFEESITSHQRKLNTLSFYVDCLLTTFFEILIFSQ